MKTRPLFVVFSMAVLCLMLIMTSCVNDPLVSVVNGTTVDLYEVRYADCYWPGPLSPGATTSPACIPAQNASLITYSLLSEFETTSPPVGPPQNPPRYESTREFVTQDDDFNRFEITFQESQIIEDN